MSEGGCVCIVSKPPRFYRALVTKLGGPDPASLTTFPLTVILTVIADVHKLAKYAEWRYSTYSYVQTSSYGLSTFHELHILPPYLATFITQRNNV